LSHRPSGGRVGDRGRRVEVWGAEFSSFLLALVVALNGYATSNQMLNVGALWNVNICYLMNVLEYMIYQQNTVNLLTMKGLPQ